MDWSRIMSNGEAKLEMDWSDSATCAFDVVAGEFVVVTPDAADIQTFSRLTSLLKRVRKAFGVESVFVSEWARGEPLVRCQRSADDEPDALQALFGERLLHLEAARGCSYRYDAVPVVTNDGVEHGTLCCRRLMSDGEPDDTAYAGALHSVARLIADWFDDAELSLSGFMPLHGTSVMGNLSMTMF
jgi:hypothetical protein